MSENAYELVLDFGNNNPDFAYGFQAGEIWTKMDAKEPFDYMFCGNILELVQTMAGRKKFSFDIQLVSYDWYSLKATPYEHQT